MKGKRREGTKKEERKKGGEKKEGWKIRLGHVSLVVLGPCKTGDRSQGLAFRPSLLFFSANLLDNGDSALLNVLWQRGSGLPCLDICLCSSPWVISPALRDKMTS